MLNEMSRPEYDGAPLPEAAIAPASPEHSREQHSLREAVAQVFDISDEEYFPAGNMLGLSAIFTGQLLIDSEAAYETLDTLLAPLGHTALFREKNGQEQVIHLIAQRFDPKPRAWWPNLLMFILTVLSLMYVGSQTELQDLPLDYTYQLSDLLRGWPYALAIVLILGAHEMGHYFAARRHNVPVTLPYFIPFPIGIFGTMGAFIQLRAPMRNRKVLFDVGAAGPLVGLIFAVPILFIGLATANVGPLPVNEPYFLEGNSLFYAFAKILTYGRFLPAGGYDLTLNQLALAGWTGLFITGLNLIPIGQLDGGHVIYTLIGERAKALYFPAIMVIAFMVIFVSDAWFLWLMLLLLFGRVHATPLDMITPLDGRRRALAWITLLIFILVFVPDPMQIIQPGMSTPPSSLF